LSGQRAGRLHHHSVKLCDALTQKEYFLPFPVTLCFEALYFRKGGVALIFKSRNSWRLRVIVSRVSRVTCGFVTRAN
jgi:hypothetical protein